MDLTPDNRPLHSFVVPGGPDARSTFHARRFADDGWLRSYDVLLEVLQFRSSATVENPPYGDSPSALFEEIARRWTGWSGERSWGAMEGELVIRASADATGHVTLRFELRGGDLPPCWTATIAVVVESGELAALAARARAFFDEVPP